MREAAHVYSCGSPLSTPIFPFSQMDDAQTQAYAHLQQKNLCSFKVIWVQIVPFLHLLTKPILPEQGHVLYHKFMLIINIKYDPI